MCLFLFIFPKFRIMQSIVVFGQGMVMVLNNLLFLDIFLYFLGIMLLFCNGYLRKKTVIKLICCLGVLFLSFTPIIFKNFHKYFMAVFFLLFVAFSYIYISIGKSGKIFLSYFHFLLIKLLTSRCQSQEVN